MVFIETPLHFPVSILKGYDNPAQDVVDQTGRRYVILIVQQIQYTNHLGSRIMKAGLVYRYVECMLIQHSIRIIPYFYLILLNVICISSLPLLLLLYMVMYMVTAAAAAESAATT